MKNREFVNDQTNKDKIIIMWSLYKESIFTLFDFNIVGRLNMKLLLVLLNLFIHLHNGLSELDCVIINLSDFKSDSDKLDLFMSF